MRQQFGVVNNEKNNVVFRLDFEPPLSAGEIVSYGFYIWTQNYYALTKREAIERYRDEWSREGMSVNDPSLFLGITVKLPAGFKYREARVEKDPVLTPDGPHVPGEVVSVFKQNEKNLAFKIERPTTGHYFVSWKSPE